MTEQLASMGRDPLVAYLRNYLQTDRVQDYCPNGLQVEGRPCIRHMVSGVTASAQLIQQAISQDADAILVHHGLFWKNDPSTLTGFRKSRLQALLGHDINLLAYHLPLDTHPEVGNNAQLALQMNWTLQHTLSEKAWVCVGYAQQTTSLDGLLTHLHQVLKRVPDCVGTLNRPIHKIAWCTGAAASCIEEAARAGADVYITGELSEPAAHIALETGTVLIGAGHHATERGGPKALGEHIAQQFGITVSFVDCFINV